MRVAAELDAALFELPRDAYVYKSCQTCGGWLNQRASHTYVVQRQGWVKIGSTRDVRRRLNELRRVAWAQYLLHPDGMDWREPLIVLGVIERDVEHELHELFVDSHVVGEFFLPDERMRAWLTTLSS